MTKSSVDVAPIPRGLHYYQSLHSFLPSHLAQTMLITGGSAGPYSPVSARFSQRSRAPGKGFIRGFDRPHLWELVTQSSESVSWGLKAAGRLCGRKDGQGMEKAGSNWKSQDEQNSPASAGTCIGLSRPRLQLQGVAAEARAMYAPGSGIREAETGFEGSEEAAGLTGCPPPRS